MTDLQVIGNRILSSSDLEKMNLDEIKARNYKYCTIDCNENGTYLAKVEFLGGCWEPTEVEYEREWISIDEFSDTEEGNAYSCENYRSCK
jgi:hypothetical protein